MLDVLFSNATLITMSDDQPTIKNAYIGVKDGFITKVTNSSVGLEAKRTIDCSDSIVLPGLINAHCHTPMCLMRGYADDCKLHQWLFKHIFPFEAKLDSAEVKIGAELGYLESIASGITSITDMYFHTPTAAKCAFDIGIRTNICNGIVCINPDGYDFEADRSTMETRELLLGLHEADGGRIRVDAAIHAQYTSPPDVWEKVIELANENKLRLQLHLSETKAEHDDCMRENGKTPAMMFYENGVFDVPTTAAHCVWVSDEDMCILAEKNVTAVHCPSSNLKLGSGIARVVEMLQKGVNVALGTDGCASNNTMDLFYEMKLAALLQKGSLLDPTVLSAYESLKLATVNGALSQGRQNSIGRIVEGFEADLIMIKMDKPHLIPSYEPISSLLYSAKGGDVFLTMVKGRILYENGDFKTIDIDRVKYDLNKFIINNKL